MAAHSDEKPIFVVKTEQDFDQLISDINADQTYSIIQIGTPERRVILNPAQMAQLFEALEENKNAKKALTEINLDHSIINHAAAVEPLRAFIKPDSNFSPAIKLTWKEAETAQLQRTAIENTLSEIDRELQTRFRKTLVQKTRKPTDDEGIMRAQWNEEDLRTERSWKTATLKPGEAAALSDFAQGLEEEESDITIGNYKRMLEILEHMQEKITGTRGEAWKKIPQNQRRTLFKKIKQSEFDAIIKDFDPPYKDTIKEIRENASAEGQFKEIIKQKADYQKVIAARQEFIDKETEKAKKDAAIQNARIEERRLIRAQEAKAAEEAKKEREAKLKAQQEDLKASQQETERELKERTDAKVAADKEADRQFMSREAAKAAAIEANKTPAQRQQEQQEEARKLRVKQIAEEHKKEKELEQEKRIQLRAEREKAQAGQPKIENPFYNELIKNQDIQRYLMLNFGANFQDDEIYKDWQEEFSKLTNINLLTQHLAKIEENMAKKRSEASVMPSGKNKKDLEKLIDEENDKSIFLKQLLKVATPELEQRIKSKDKIIQEERRDAEKIKLDKIKEDLTKKLETYIAKKQQELESRQKKRPFLSGMRVDLQRKIDIAQHTIANMKNDLDATALEGLFNNELKKDKKISYFEGVLSREIKNALEQVQALKKPKPKGPLTPKFPFGERF